MQNKNILITGSSRGIGFAVAKSFGLLGANVVLNCANSENELHNAVKHLSDLGIKCTGVMGNVAEYENCKHIIDSANNMFGDIDVLVNNAAISEFGLFTDLEPNTWDKITKINQYSVYNCCHLVLPTMIRKREGAIINISSIWGVSGASCEVLYSATKGAVNSFTKALAKEVAPSNVFVNAVACGVIDTKMNERLTETEKEQLIEQIGLMKLGTPQDVAELCVYLARTKYMTGQVLALDGGML